MTEEELREVYNILVECWKDYKKYSRIVGEEDSEQDWSDYIDSTIARSEKYNYNNIQRRLDAVFLADIERRALEHMEKNQ